MLSIANIQTTLQAAIAAHPYFAGITVIVDDGRQDAAIETQLTGNGFVVVIPPVLGGKALSQAGGKLLLAAEVMVRVMLNPEANSAAGTGAQKGAYAAIAAVTAAVLGWRPAGGLPGTSEKLFEASADFLAISNFDPGLIIYDLSFTKHTTPN